MLPPHHAPGGRFRNPWPGRGDPSLRDMLRFFREAAARAPTPRRGSFPGAPPAVVYPRGDAGVLSATWVGHSTVLLQLGNRNVITDPVFSPRAFPVQWAGPRRAMPLGPAAYVRPWGVRNLIEVDWRQEVVVKDMRITGTPARHFSARGFRDRNRSLWCGFALESAGSRVYFAGDSAYHPEFGAIGTRCGPFDLVLIPIGAYEPRWFMNGVHASAEEGVRIYQDLVAAHPGAPLTLMLAIHWGTFRLTTEPMDEPPRRAADQWRAMQLDPDRLWIAKFGETRRVK